MSLPFGMYFPISTLAFLDKIRFLIFFICGTFRARYNVCMKVNVLILICFLVFILPPSLPFLSQSLPFLSQSPLFTPIPHCVPSHVLVTHLKHQPLLLRASTATSSPLHVMPSSHDFEISPNKIELIQSPAQLNFIAGFICESNIRPLSFPLTARKSRWR